MAAFTNLYRKGDAFYARFRIPQRLTSWLQQTELRWSLRTSSLKTAKKHLLIASVLVQELFTLAYKTTAYDPLTEAEKIAIKAELEKIKFTKLAQFKALISQGDAGIIDAQRLLTSEQPLIEAFARAIDSDNFDQHEVITTAQELLQVVDRVGYDFSSRNPNFSILAKEYCSSFVLQNHTKRKLLRQALDQGLLDSDGATSGPAISKRENRPSNTVTPAKPPDTHLHKTQTPLSDVIEEYLADHKGRGTTEKTIQEYRGVLVKLVDFLEDRPIESLQRKDLMGFREMLKTYPARPTLEQRKLGLIALVQLDLVPKLGLSSIAKHLDRASQFMTWAERSGYDVKASMAQGLQPKSSTKESEERDRYSSADLNLLFATPHFQGEKPFNRTAFFWAPLIAIYSGMRLDEICQLRTQDIYTDPASGLHVISINDEGDDRKLKNKSSPRIIPLHSKLEAAGLIDYVEMIRSKRHRMLFPTLNRHPRNGYSHAVSKWFSEYKTELGFDSKKVFHSFRHTVSDHLKQALQNPAIVDAILGHATKGSENQRRYGKDYRIDLMKPVIESLDFDVPALPFGKILLADSEKSALRSAKAADALREKRRTAKSGESISKD